MKWSNSFMNRQFATQTDGPDCSPETVYSPKMSMLTGFSDIKNQLSVSLFLRCVITNPLFIGLCSNTRCFFFIPIRSDYKKKYFSEKFRVVFPIPNKKAIFYLQSEINSNIKYNSIPWLIYHLAKYDYATKMNRLIALKIKNMS